MPLADYQNLLAGLAPGLRETIDRLYLVLDGAGFECYLVGGLVRDLLLGRETGDVDIATNARPDQVQALFRRTIPTGIKHGTVTVLLGGLSFEVTTYRADGAYSDGRHPDAVAFSQRLGDDLARRDFTINALAFEPGRRELVDEFAGLDDLARKLIRTIGEPRARFFEDGLRPVRACRFATSLGFDLERSTRAALADPEVHARTRLVAVERFADELWKGFKFPAAARMVRLLEESGLLRLFAIGRPPYPTGGADASLEDLGQAGPCAPALRMAWWWRAAGVAPDRIQDLSRQLKLSGARARDIRLYRAYLDFQANIAPRTKTEARAFLSEIKATYAGAAGDFLAGAPDLEVASFPREELNAILTADPLVLGDLFINGQDLIAGGLTGPRVGQVLRRLLEEVWGDPDLNQRDRLLARAGELRDAF